jgi:hypothetical protein
LLARFSFIGQVERQQMSVADRFFCTFAVAFVMVPILHADGTATPNVKQDESVVTVVGPAVAEPVGAMHNDTPKVEWYLGYSFWRAVPTSPNNRMGYLHGGNTSLAYNLNSYIGLVADFAGYDDNKLTLLSPTGSRTVDSNGIVSTYAVGPRFSYRRYKRFIPFVQALFGGVHASTVRIAGCTGTTSCTPLGSDNALTAITGTGLDIKISKHVVLRLFEGDFLLTHFKNPVLMGGQDRGWQKNARFSTGIVFRFGG